MFFQKNCLFNDFNCVKNTLLMKKSFFKQKKPQIKKSGNILFFSDLKWKKMIFVSKRLFISTEFRLNRTYFC